MEQFPSRLNALLAPSQIKQTAAEFHRLDREKQSHRSDTPSPRPRVYRLDELIEEPFPESECFLAKDLLTRGDICLVAGRRKVGKSYVILHMVGCLAGGVPFGPYETRPARILYLSQEMSEKAMHRRLKKLFQPEQYKRIAANLHVICKYKFKLDSEDGARLLVSLIQEAEEPYDGIVIDALRDVKGRFKEGDNDEMGELMVRLRDDVCLPCNVFCILIHHMGKPPKEGEESRGGRGASVIEDVVTEAIYLERLKGQKKRRGVFAITREGELEGSTFTYEISGEEESNTVHVDVMEGGEESDDEDIDVRQMGEWIASEAFDVSRDQVMGHFQWGRSTAYKNLKRGVNLGLISKSKTPDGVKYGPKK